MRWRITTQGEQVTPVVVEQTAFGPFVAALISFARQSWSHPMHHHDRTPLFETLITAMVYLGFIGFFVASFVFPLRDDFRLLFIISGYTFALWWAFRRLVSCRAQNTIIEALQIFLSFSFTAVMTPGVGRMIDTGSQCVNAMAAYFHLVTLLVVVLPLIGDWRRKKLRKQMLLPVCDHCGYCLRGLSEPRCPECGTPFDPDIISSAARRSDGERR